MEDATNRYPQIISIAFLVLVVMSALFLGISRAIDTSDQKNPDGNDLFVASDKSIHVFPRLELFISGYAAIDRIPGAFVITQGNRNYDCAVKLMKAGKKFDTRLCATTDP